MAPTTLAFPIAAEGLTELKGATDLRALIPSLQVTTHDEFQFAAAFVAQLKAQAQRLKARRDEFTQPAKDFVEAVRLFYAPVVDAYEQAESEIKEKLAAYRARVEAARVAAMKMGQDAGAPVEAKGTSIRMKRKIRIVASSAVPREFCTPNEKLLQQCADLPGDYSEGRLRTTAYPDGVPGVEVYEDAIVTVRAEK